MSEDDFDRRKNDDSGKPNPVINAVSNAVAAIRAELFQRCLPLVTNDLEVRAARRPEDAGVRGACQLILEEVLAPARIDRLVREQASASL